MRRSDNGRGNGRAICPVPGRELKGIHFAMEYLTQQNKRTAGISVSEEPITAKG